MRNYEEYSIEENVQFINEQLSNGLTMLEVEKECYGAMRNAITMKLKRKGYKRSKDGKRLFVLVRDHNNSNNNSNANNSSINNNSGNNSIITKVMISEEEYKQLLELIEIKEDMKQLLYNCNNNNSNNNNSSNIDVMVAKDVSLRQMKIDNEVYNKFREFCSNHKQYKYQDLVSTALNEFVEKYSKR